MFAIFPPSQAVGLKANIKCAWNTCYMSTKETRNNQEMILTSLTENVNDARKEMEGAETSLMVTENTNEVNIDITHDKMDDTFSEMYATTLVGYCVVPGYS